MKKICIFSASYLPSIGGVERYTYYLAKELIKLGHEVTVVTSNILKLPTHEVLDEIEIYRLPCYNVMKGRYPIYKNNAEFKRIDKALNERDFDLIIVNTRFYFHSLYGAKLAHKNNIKCITIEHGTTHLSVNNAVFDYLGEIWEHIITYFLKRYCKNFYGVSKAACEWSGHFGIKSKGVIYNAIDLNEINELIENPVCSYRKDFNIPKDAIIITYTGRIIPEKGVKQLVEAFGKLTQKNCYLMIAGDGPLFNEIKSINNPHIITLGKIDFSHIIALLKESDIFCLPSVSEGLSTSVLEAVATKTFVITTKTGGSKELVAGEGYGIIMDSNSSEEVLEALERAVNDHEYRQSSIENCYQRLSENFTWSKTSEKVIDIIEVI